MADDEQFILLLEAMKRAAAALRDHDVAFALAGGLAVYARGGPPTEHDVDFLLRPEDTDRAIEALSNAGFHVDRPPEGWLYKALDEGDQMIDLIFAPNNRPDVVPEMLDRATDLEVHAITMPVMTVTDVLRTKLLTLKEHEVDYENVLEIARTCREQIEWDYLRARTDCSPYARAFFTLADGLGLTA